MKREIYITADSPDALIGAESLKRLLHAKFGYNAVRIAYRQDGPEPGSDAIHIQGDQIPAADDGRGHFAADIITSHLRLSHADLSSREDAAMLDRYRSDDGSLDLTPDPRLWIRTNPFLEKLDHDPSYSNLIDYVVEEKGLFLKPALYSNQRNYWNSVTNAGLPITKKRDPIHEGTFMLHDLYHFALQDPLPMALDESISSRDLRKAYLMHRMASEATTLVMADMLAIEHADLESMGYDVRRRRIFPIYQDILENNPSIDQQALIEANLDFCFTGDVVKLRALGASEASLQNYRNKYEVFFSADFIWNDTNFAYCTLEYSDRPRYHHYAQTVQRLFGTPTIDILYPSPGNTTVETIADSFNHQLVQAQAYQSGKNELDRLKAAGSKYLSGQLLLFYTHHAPNLIGEYVDLSEQFITATSEANAKAILNTLKTMVSEYLHVLRASGAISSQDHALNLMHVPFYPAQFIHYDRDADGYRNLSQNISDLKI